MTEDDLIARYFAPLAGSDGLGLRDDAARMACEAGQDLIVTCDALVAGVHFFPEDPAEAIAAKALRVNLSDLAAKGATPRGFVLSLALDDRKADWLDAFAAGLKADIAAYACPLLGGDTVRTPGPLTLSITAFGLAPHGRMLPRTGAQAGDLVYVSGTIGDAALGLLARQGSIPPRDHLLERYLRPQPRNALAPALRAHARAAMDVSDGLAGDLAKMMRLEGLSAEIDVDAIPLSPDARAAIGTDEALLKCALSGGDDYEILACVPPAAAEEFERAAAEAGVSVTRIGRVVTEQGAPAFRKKGGRLLAFRRSSYSHF